MWPFCLSLLILQFINTFHLACLIPIVSDSLKSFELCINNLISKHCILLASCERSILAPTLKCLVYFLCTLVEVYILSDYSNSPYWTKVNELLVLSYMHCQHDKYLNVDKIDTSWLASGCCRRYE